MEESKELDDLIMLRQKAKLKITKNLYSKNELKKLFIYNYGNFETVRPLYNNKRYQCFRNSAFVLLMRYQKKIWDSIDELPTVEKYDDLDRDNKNKYLIIQTLIELMDDYIINKFDLGEIIRFDSMGGAYIINNLESKRTGFLDDRLDSYLTDGYEKCTRLGLVDKYAEVYFSTMQLITEEPIEDIRLRGVGGYSIMVLELILKDIFNEEHPFITVNSFSDIQNVDNNFNKDYVLYNLTNVIESTARNVFDLLNIKKTIENESKETYVLVGILYDCPNGEFPHQITSVCFKDECTRENSSGYITHHFYDDTVIDKSLIPIEFSSGVDTGLNLGCKKDGIVVQFVLYEKRSATETLKNNIRDFVAENELEIDIDSVLIYGGGNNVDHYKFLYLNYKNKYLLLKKK